MWRAESAVQRINKDLEGFCQPKILPVIVFDKIIIIIVTADVCYWKRVISNSCGMIMTATSTCEIKCMFPWIGIAHICKYPTYYICLVTYYICWKLVTYLKYYWDVYVFRSFWLMSSKEILKPMNSFKQINRLCYNTAY